MDRIKNLVRVINKAKREILISCGEDCDYRGEQIESALECAQKRGVKIIFLTGPGARNEIFRDRKVLYAKNYPKVSFVVVDSAHIVLKNGKARLGDKISGGYLRGKFIRAKNSVIAG